MRTTVLGIGLTGLLAALLVTVLPLDAAEEKHRDQQMVAVVYPIADLPVWTIGEDKPTFDPKVLIAHLKSAVDPQSWETASVNRHEKTASLVVRQTRANHQKIAELLTSLRPRHPGEEAAHGGLGVSDAAILLPCEQ